MRDLPCSSFSSSGRGRDRRFHGLSVPEKNSGRPLPPVAASSAPDVAPSSSEKISNPTSPQAAATRRWKIRQPVETPDAAVTQPAAAPAKSAAAIARSKAVDALLDPHLSADKNTPCSSNCARIRPAGPGHFRPQATRPRQSQQSGNPHHSRRSPVEINCAPSATPAADMNDHCDSGHAGRPKF